MEGFGFQNVRISLLAKRTAALQREGPGFVSNGQGPLDCAGRWEDGERLIAAGKAQGLGRGWGA